MSRNRSKYVHDEHCLSLTHDGDCDCPRPRTLRRPDSSPHGSTGAPICVCEPGECMGLGPATGSRCRRGVQPSAEAIEVADERMENFRPSERWDSGGRRQKTVAVTTAAYAIDAPAIAREAHAAGVAEGRAAMRDDIRAWARCQLPQHYDDALLGGQIADLIEARFPSEGTI